MTEFVFGLGSMEKSTYILQKMQCSLKAGRRVVLIVPEQQALVWDRRCAQALPAGAMLQTEIVSFTRLADSVFRRFGGVAKHYITDAKKTLVMWNTLVALRDSLHIYGREDREDRYVPLLLHAVSELKAYSVTPAMLAEAAEQLQEGQDALRDKLLDLSTVFAAYDTLLHISYDDPQEIPDALIQTLSMHNYFAGCDVYIDSFYTFTPGEKGITKQILQQAADFTMTFACPLEADGDGSEMHLEHIRRFVHDMARMCAQSGRQVCAKEISCTLSGPLGVLTRSLWDHKAQPYLGEADNVKVIRCADVYDEAYAAAGVIQRLVQQGASYRDIAVVAADMESRRSITDTILSDLGIPIYLSGKKTAVMQPAVRLLLTAASVVAGGWRREDVVSCAKTGLTGVSPDCCDALEQYTEKWRIRGRRMFCDPDGWNMNPDGYTETVSAWGRELLSMANQARAQLAPVLDAFADAFPGTARTVCTAAYRLLCDFDVYNGLQREADRLEKQGDAAAAQEVRQVWSVLCDILDTIAQGAESDLEADGAHMDAARFYGLCLRTAQSCKIGTIPDGMDRVVLGSAHSIRLDDVRHVIVLGAVYGEFPAVPLEGGFFGELDKETLAALGIQLSPGVAERQGEALFHFYRAVCAPTDTLTVMIPCTDGAWHPSSGAVRIMQLLPNAKVTDLTSPDPLEMVWSKSAARRLLPILLHTPCGDVLGDMLRDEQVPKGSLSADREQVALQTAQALFGGTLSMTQSRLETFGDCPFSYYCRYVLHLDEGRTAEIRPVDVGNFVHKILEDFMRESAQEGFPLSNEMIVNRAERLIREYIASVSQGAAASRRTDYLFRRLQRSVILYGQSLSEEFDQSDFIPYAFELPVGFDDTLPALRIPLSGDGVMTMRGIVDRLDILRRNGKVYVRVADYKTGSKNFSLQEVLSGHNVQLLLYLFSICGSAGSPFYQKLAPMGEELVPAGAVYFSARPGDASSPVPLDGDTARETAKKNISRQGIILWNDAVIRAMDKDVSGKYIPVTVNKDGSYSKYSSLASKEEFEEIYQGLTAALQQAGNQVKSGRACSRPVRRGGRLPCDSCPMRAVCRHME